MKTIRCVIMMNLLCTIFVSVSFAGGIVGNGAGIVEQNIQFIYMSLPNIIAGCVSHQNQCPVTQDEQTQLQKITEVVRQNYSLSGRILFASEKQSPGFFTTSSTENNRIAKTALTETSPIYFNVDELYNSQGLPAIDFAGLAAILVHEIGHQTGEPSHTKLDILGAKIRIFLGFQLTSFSYSFSNSLNLEINLINYPIPTPIGDIYLSSQNGKSVQLTPKLMNALRCQSPDETLVGFNMTNGHWNRIATDPNLIEFEAWLQVFCRSSMTKGGDLINLNQDFLIRINNDADIVSFEIL